ncbi:MAG: TolC family protein [Gammaproteobacteria bacterium]|nr:TolC family protein [Gammaproteobacteria bacterium]MBU1482008.1 TolC family protein [Gammaproteobacteria bacterium]
MDEAVTLALSGNPGLAAMQARARALAEVPSQVGTLPDPTLTLGVLSVPTDTYSLSQEAMTQSQIGIGFTLPFPGKLGLREQVAELEAATASNDVDEKRLVLVRSVRSVWWNLFYLDRALAIVQRNRNLLREFVRVAETKYKTGMGMQSDVLLAQVELSKLLDMEIAVQASRRSQASALNALLGRSANTPIMLPQLASETLPPAPDGARLLELAGASRPLIVSRRNALLAARSRTQLAEKDYYPDLRIGASYGYRRDADNGTPRADLASITLNMNLPLFAGSRQGKAVSQRRAEALKEEYNLRDAEVQVGNEIEQAMADYVAAREQASLYKQGIIPQSSQTAASMLAAYQVNKVDFLNLVRAQIALYNNENQYWKTVSAGWQAWARLESATGTPLAAGNTNNDKESNNEQRQ